MAIRSMTGYARLEGSFGDFQWVWELKSVNSKGFDARFRMPSMIDGLDIEGRKRLSRHISRGSVSVSLDLNREGEAALPQLNDELFAKILAIAAEHQDQPGVAPASLDGLLALRGVLESDSGMPDKETLDNLRQTLLDDLNAAGALLRKSREGEGAALAEMLAGQLEQINALVAAAGNVDAVRLEAIRERFAAKVAELMPDGVAVDEGRLAQEIATLAVKADIREELDRLKAHIEAARDLLAEDDTVGRKLDFLCQEFNREANTLCSKSNDVDLTRLGLDLKAVIEQFREQVQNVE